VHRKIRSSSFSKFSKWENVSLGFIGIKTTLYELQCGGDMNGSGNPT
jgi:hypothetical protein